MVKSSRTKSHALIRLEQQSANSPDVPDSRTLQAFCAVKSQTISAFRQGLVNHARQGLVNHADRSGPGDFGLTSLFKLIAETARLRSRVSIGNIIPAGRQSREASNIYRRDQSRRVEPCSAARPSLSSAQLPCAGRPRRRRRAAGRTPSRTRRAAPCCQRHADGRQRSRQRLSRHRAARPRRRADAGSGAPRSVADDSAWA